MYYIYICRTTKTPRELMREQFDRGVSASQGVRNVAREHNKIIKKRTAANWYKEFRRLESSSKQHKDQNQL